LLNGFGLFDGWFGFLLCFWKYERDDGSVVERGNNMSPFTRMRRMGMEMSYLRIDRRTYIASKTLLLVTIQMNTSRCVHHVEVGIVILCQVYVMAKVITRGFGYCAAAVVGTDHEVVNGPVRRDHQTGCMSKTATFHGRFGYQERPPSNCVQPGCPHYMGVGAEVVVGNYVMDGIFVLLDIEVNHKGTDFFPWYRKFSINEGDHVFGAHVVERG
jgi:hypothetical protein